VGKGTVAARELPKLGIGYSLDVPRTL